jgi:hypothetical protein
MVYPVYSFLGLQVFLLTFPVELTKIVELYVYLDRILEPDSPNKIRDGSLLATKKECSYHCLFPVLSVCKWLATTKKWIKRRNSLKSTATNEFLP